MNKEEKRKKVIMMIDDLYGNDGMAVVNLITDYMSDDNWGHLYDRLEQDGTFKEPEETTDGMADGLAYLREQLEQDEIDEIHAQIDRSYRYHMNPSDCVTNDAKVIDLLEEYGADNDLPEGWWENYGDIDDWLLKL